LGKKVHAELLKSDIDLKFLHIDVPEPGIAKISGMVLTTDDQARIKEIVESVAGVSSVQSNVVLMPTGYS
jgi:osmotically-inducible protein OsmY